MNNNKFSVTFTFPTKDMLQEFCAYMSDGGGEQGMFGHDDIWDRASFDYTRCRQEEGPKFVDVNLISDTEDQ